MTADLLSSSFQEQFLGSAEMQEVVLCWSVAAYWFLPTGWAL
jgi:hypothetical protein